MEYVIGLLVSLAVVGLGASVGLNRERGFYPIVLMVTASYYVLFAAMGASSRTLIIEILVACGFLLVAQLGFRKSLWFVVAGLVGHGVFDVVHHVFIQNPGMPVWWPGFCLAFDALLGVILAVGLVRRRERLIG